MVKAVSPFKSPSKHPLAAALKTAFGSSKNKFLRHVGLPTINIVSPGLCDDILTYIGPSLAHHRGCDVIDINPGCGLWSSKVHEILKPRTHLLLETELASNAFEPFLKPLLSQSSAFRHATYKTQQGWHWIDNLWNIIEKGNLLSSEQGVDETNEGHNRENNSVFILANLSHILKFTENLTKADSSAHRFVYQLCKQLRRRSGFHSRGPLRMLLWTDDVEKYFLMPRSINFRSAALLQREELYDYREVASCGSNFMTNRRPLSIDLRSSLSTAQRMIDAGLQIPHHRRSNLHHAAYETAIKSNISNISPELTASEIPKAFEDDISWLPELEDLEERFFSGLGKHYEAGFGMEKYCHDEHEIARITELQDKADILIPRRYRIWSSKAVDVMLALELRINELERQIALNGLANISTTTLNEAWRYLTEQYDEKTRYHHSSLVSKSQGLVDNFEAFRQNPPLLAWDRRLFEPIQTIAADFWPQIPLALYDFQLTEAECHSKFLDDRFVNAIMCQGQKPVRTALDALGPSTAEAILGAEYGQSGKCSSLYSPLKGGRMNIRNLRVRMLAINMLRDLRDAFHSSPFTTSIPTRQKYSVF